MNVDEMTDEEVAEFVAAADVLWAAVFEAKRELTAQLARLGAWLEQQLRVRGSVIVGEAAHSELLAEIAEARDTVVAACVARDAHYAGRVTR